MLRGVRRVLEDDVSAVSVSCPVVSPEDAPARGACAVCTRALTRSSFCCGCGHFVCWTHGEPGPVHEGSSTFPMVPHGVQDHRGMMKITAA